MELQQLSELAVHDFIQHLNRRFDIKFEDHVTLSAELIEIQELSGYSPLERKPFLLVFRTEQKNEYYPQATFIVFHPQKGDFPVFMTPKGFDSVGMKYEAIFS